MIDGHAHKAEAQRLTEEIWGLIRKPAGVTGGDMAAAVVRMLRERAACWERAGEIEMYGECHAIADLIEGRAPGFGRKPSS
jgi:hypothetical protein